MRWCTTGHRMADDDRFCGLCGSLPATAGPRCTNGHPAGDGDRFCGICGAAVSSDESPSPPMSEMTASDDTNAVSPWEQTPLPPKPVIPPIGASYVPPAAPTPPGPADPTAALWAPPTAQLPTTDATAGQRPPAGRRRRWPITAAAVVVALAVIGSGAYFAGQRLSHRHHTVTSAAKPSAKVATGTARMPPSTSAATNDTTSSTTTVPTPPTTAPAPHLSAHQVANRISALIVRSAADRNTVVNAAAELQDCSDVSGALNDFETLETRRRNLLTQLKTLQVSPLTHGATIKTDLTAAWQASLAADEAYATWAQDADGDCTPNQDPNAAQVDAANAAATRAKTAFASAWNPVATLYSLPTVTQATI